MKQRLQRGAASPSAEFVTTTRLVAGKLRRQECFEQLVDPQRCGRHTVPGDAMVTAEVLLKMLPLLQALGITTLAQALDASRKTCLARVSC